MPTDVYKKGFEMKINVKAYEAKRYYSLNDVKNGEEVIELEMPRKVFEKKQKDVK